jgi:soluble P-type ATPase
MIDIKIPGYGHLEFDHLVMDYNGTMACDGHLVNGIKEILDALSGEIDIHVLTADTFGRAASQLENVAATLSILPVEAQDKGKLAYIRNLGADRTVSIGNGRNDSLMLKHSALGIALIQEEGASVETLLSAHIVCKDILSALRLLMNPKRMVATLRS